MSFWIKNLVAGKSIKLVPTADLRITNVALSCEYKDALGRTSLVLSPPQPHTNSPVTFTIVNLIPLHIEQFHIDMRLVRGQTYILSSRGPNDLTLLGYYAEEIFPPVSASVSQQSTTGTPGICVQPPSLPDIGHTGPAPPSVVTGGHATPAATDFNTLGQLRSPFENTQKHAISTAPPPPSRMVTPATANNSNSPFSFNFQYTKTGDPTPAMRHIQPTDNSPSLENQQLPSSQTFVVPRNPAPRDSSHSMTIQNAPLSSSGIAGPVAGPVPSMPQAKLKRKAVDDSSDSLEKRRMASNSRAPQSASRSNHPSSHPTSNQQPFSGPTNEPGRRAPQSASRPSNPSSHPTPSRVVSSGSTNNPVHLDPNVNPVIPTDARSTAAPAPSMLHPELRHKVAGGSTDLSQHGSSRTFTPQPSSRPMSKQQVFEGHTGSHMIVNSPVPLNASLPPDTAPGRSYLLPPGANFPVQTNSHINGHSQTNRDAPLAPGTAPAGPAPN